MQTRKTVATLVTLAAPLLLLAGEPAEMTPDSAVPEELSTPLAESLRKLVLKEAVYNDLIAARLTLAQAVDECDAIEGQFPELADGFRRGLAAVVPGRTYRERLARSIVQSIEVMLQDRPSPDAAVLARLHAELQDFIANDNPS
jgi:hypothetical protein